MNDARDGLLADIDEWLAPFRQNKKTSFYSTQHDRADADIYPQILTTPDTNAPYTDAVQQTTLLRNRNPWA